MQAGDYLGWLVHIRGKANSKDVISVKAQCALLTDGINTSTITTGMCNSLRTVLRCCKVHQCSG